MQSLVGLTSLAILKLPLALESLFELSTASVSAADDSGAAPYLLNVAAVNEVNDVLTQAASVCLLNASPAVFAWGILMQTAREIALFNRESREVRQSQRAADRYGTADSSDTDSGDRPASSKWPNRRRSSTGSDTSQQSSYLEEILDRIMDTALDEDPISFLAKCAVDGSHVFTVITTLAIDFCTPFGAEHDGKSGLKMRRLLLDLIRAALDWVPYQPELVLATLAVLTGAERSCDLRDRPKELHDAEPAWYFLNEDSCMQNFYLVALCRFPYESVPFLKLCRALAICKPAKGDAKLPIWNMLQELDSFTCRLPAGFDAYETVREDEDANYIRLKEGLSNYSIGSPSAQPKKSMRFPRALTASAQSPNLLELPPGTVGRALSETRPFVVLWHHENSALEYMGKVLRCASANDNMSIASASSPLSREVVGEIIALLTTMLLSAAQNTTAPDLDVGRSILEKTSDGLDRNQDVISIIFNIFEDELHRRWKISEIEGPGDILVRCIQFTHGLLPFMPDRVWPFLGRSGLLGINDGESLLSSVVMSMETVVGRYGFLLGCIRVLEALLADTITHAVSRKIPTKAVARFGTVDAVGTGVSQTSMKTIILGFMRLLTDVLGSTENWKFLVQEERLEINTRICNVISTILAHCYAVDEGMKLTEALAPTAEYLLAVFLGSSGELALNPLLHIFLEGVNAPATSLVTNGMSTSQVKAALNLSSLLIELNRLLDKRSTVLEDKLFKATPILAKLYVVHDTFKPPVVRLVDALIRSVAVADEQPPSLFSCLGQGIATHFLDILSVTDQPFSDDVLSTGIWRLLAAVVSKRQQWFAIFVLTGSTPRQVFKNRDSADKSRHLQPIWSVALERLSELDKVRPERAVSMLEFVKTAADHWPWVLTTLEQHPEFLKSASRFLEGLQSSTDEGDRPSKDFNKLQMGAYITDILAMYTHHTQQAGNLTFARKLLPSLTYVIQYAVSVPSYNHSLHQNLKRNFESRFPGCSLTSFKRTTLTRPTLGKRFYYDLEIASEMLSFDAAWSGKKNSGFLGEFERANVNMSLVEAQVSLLHSWKSLAVKLSAALSTDSKFQTSMIGIISRCLESNIAECDVKVAVFEELARTRAELAFTLLERLVHAKCAEPSLRTILATAWDTLRSFETDLEIALQNDNADYYRLLLKILCLALQVHTNEMMASAGSSDDPKPSVAPETTNIVLEIINVVVARGFRSLVNLLHTSLPVVQPADFGLITALLRTSFSIPGITRSTTHLVTAFADSQTARCASTLLSWSDQLATNNDPIFGELSILFLLEMSSVPTLAESLAVEGVLNHICNTNLVKQLQQPKGMGPFDTPMRLYSIWSRGLLPFLLHLLHAVGAPIAAEIAGVLNSFESQLARASSAFDEEASPPLTQFSKRITVSMASEAQSLAVISGILDNFREAGASAGVVAANIAAVKWNRAQVREDLETWMANREALRHAIVPTSDSEELYLKAKPTQESQGWQNKLEERVVESLMTTLSIIGTDNDR